MYSSIISRQTRRKIPLIRSLSSATSPDIRNSVYISHSTNPYFNLTFEDWLFRHGPPESPLLFLYRNSPCVVIGRNQNPWKEVNMGALRERGVPFVRRRSGGGTVYHDLGNTNFSIHLARRAFDRRATAQLVLRAVLSLGIENARLNDRNDLCVGADKVSGSAYKIVNTRAYHHGTMLISTQLNTLGDLLRTDKEAMVTAGVASVRSPVCNLQQSSPQIEHAVFARAVVDEFRTTYELDEGSDPMQNIDESSGDPAYIQRGMDELKSWDWQYGQTPEFTYTLDTSFPWGPVVSPFPLPSLSSIYISRTPTMTRSPLRPPRSAQNTGSSCPAVCARPAYLRS
ncbi:hypothetical protein DFH07DRAFT_804529 [Mycena maculata]|uniref:Putative lipoate-protein ligase A n=1 Tax=Mycena maculata TaxID=230809 RepID=A0AAD7JSM4_9AGAR|nr:hypothetical protein DFH07DRAFT_804529 [Mycena maculata]